jgi:hypothetical protein
LAITAHILDEETNMSSNLLECVEFNEKHTAAKFADITWDRRMEDWL